MFAALDNKGRLFVTESSGNDLYKELLDQVRKCRVSLLEDRDGDGIYEKATVFAENLTPSMGLVWREGKLYVADPPDLVTLEDTDGDDRADKRTVVLTGFGHTDNGSLHGLTFGPDGWLYFTTGNPDGYDLHGPDGSHARGQVGALLRCRADGSRVETIARGFENLVEIVFLPDWTIIGTVTWYSLPERGVRDALVQLLEEGQFPIHPVDSTVPHLQFNAVLPPVALFPAVAHSGLEIYHDGNFPPEMRGNLFSAQHNARKIVRHQLTPKGSSYSCETSDFVTTEDPDVHFSDVLEDRDGSLLLVDTGSWYVQHCPTGRIRQAPARGGIYRISFAQPPSAPIAQHETPATNWMAGLTSTNVTVVAAAARHFAREPDARAVPELSKLLKAKDLRVRLAAAEALAHCGNAESVPALIEALSGETDAFLEHALTYALYRLANSAVLTAALKNPSPKVQSAALLLLDQPPFRAATAEAVVPRLDSADPSLQENARWVLWRHPEWSVAGVALLHQLLKQPNPTEADRHALAKVLPVFANNSLVTDAFADSLSSDKLTLPDQQRAYLLDTLAGVNLPDPPGRLENAIIQSLRSASEPVAVAAIRTAAALRLPNTEKPLAALALDPARNTGVRLEAMRELVRRRPALDSAQMDFLLVQLSSTNLPTARLAAAEVLAGAKLDSAQMTSFLKIARGDAVISPGLILGACERNGLQPDMALPLLDYLAASLDAGWTVSPEQGEKLQQAIPDAQRARANALLDRVSQSVERQRQQLIEFVPLLTGGDFVRGEKIFFEKGQCVTCHRIWENGGWVGPDLSRVGAIRSGRDLLESLLIPSATIAQGYDTLNVTTKEDDTFTGIRVGSGQYPLRLRLASGTELVLHQDEIQNIQRSKVSLMPEGLLNTLNRDEIRDLLAFLQHLK
jgi:putative heme-binding domain-containing protein